jgi:hypothetical protein
MPKPPRQEISASAFPFVRQFTAPPFFMGLEDAKLRGELLVEAVKQAGKGAMKQKKEKTLRPKSRKTPIKKTAVPKKRAALAKRKK